MIDFWTEKEIASLTVWVRMSEILSMEGNRSLPDYNRKKLMSSMVELKEIAAEYKNDYKKGFEKAKDVLYDCGVNFFFVDSLPLAPLRFMSRWYAQRPLIQLSELGYEKDFWFELFHSIGHIAKHGKKYIFMEVNGIEKRKFPELEKEADKFAFKHLK